jgi:hypothetical protein
MKTLILILTFVAVAIGSSAQNLQPNDIPSSVVKSFNKKNPKAEQVEWSKTGESFKASFMDNNLKKSYTYDANGKMKQNEMQVTISNLPTPVIKYLNDNFPGEVIKQSVKITNASGKSSYMVKVKESDLEFDSNGRFLKSQ